MKQTRLVTIVGTAALVLGLSGAVALAVDNIDPDNDGAQFGWGENIGWANAEPGGDGGPGVLVENDMLSGYIWAENVGWINLSCLTNASCGSVDYRVSNDGSGNLDGFGWGENIGWVNFNPATGGGVTINPTTGEFSGDAWSENVGWIRLRGQGTVQYGVTTAWRGAPACVPASNDPTGADLNNDGIVNILDISLVGSCFSATPPEGACQVTDTNCNGGVGMDDLQFIVGFFGQTVP